MAFFAHSSSNQDRSDWQSLAEHLEAVADHAAENAKKFGADEWGRMAGLLHDIGKYSREFQIERLEKKDGRRVDHSSAGARIAAERYGRPGRLLAFCLAGHHAGLANGSSGGGNSITALTDRLENADIPELDPSWEDGISLPDALQPPAWKSRQDKHGPDRGGFQAAFFTRMLFSCLIDADRRDTAAFYERLDSIAPAGESHSLQELRSKLDAHLLSLAAKAADKPDPGRRAVNAHRAEILAHVRAKATERPGLFSLTVPTGGGKTLTSLAFALDHAIKHGLDRVIYVIPFTSIIEQTANVFRDALGDLDSAVLEHHSALDWEKATRRAEDADRRDGERELRLAMESWDKPIVVTTAVQFFESLFSNRTTKCRKLHNIARSVVILDEAQKLPLNLLRPCVAALDELSRNYRSSIVLCTATQPAIVEDEKLPEGGFKSGLQDVRELAPEPKQLYKAFSRVTVEHAGTLDDAALTERLKAEHQVLCVVNSRAHARVLYDAIESEGGARHLTTLMCAKHRSEVLEEIKQDLKDQKPCRLVATSLVEAGVDVDFPTVYRAEAGIDSIAQAAGRCNREGKRKPEDSKVIVFETLDHKGPSELKQFASIGRNIARRHKDDMLSLEAVEAYFRDLYWLKEQGNQSELDKCRIIERFHERARTLDFEFESIARDFRMIESRMVPVIIPWDETAKKALRNLEHADRVGGIARRLQPYLAQVKEEDRKALIASGAAYAVRQGDFGEQFVRLRERDPEIYDPAVGLRIASDLSPSADKFIF
ncbi:MAG: CRISPR-associated helicase Cas3' [Pseudorhodoplanes sp.]